jgi:hypothetical protein
VAGQLLLETPLEAPVKRVRLGNIPVGEHILSITSTHAISAYLNHIESDTPPAYLQRFCIETHSNALRFAYVKRSPTEEILALRLFSPAQAEPEPFDVRVELKPPAARGVGPFPTLTLMKREARVTPTPTRGVRLVGGTPSVLDDGQFVFIPVGPDMPPGNYELEISVAASSPRWLSLSRTTPGRTDQLELVSKRRSQ